jgi:hypothetical protein
VGSRKKAAKSSELSVQKLLDAAGVSQRLGAKLIGINERTMRKYIAGDLVPPKPVMMALELLAQTKRRES